LLSYFCYVREDWKIEDLKTLLMSLFFIRLNIKKWNIVINNMVVSDRYDFSEESILFFIGSGRSSGSVKMSERCVFEWIGIGAC